MASNILGLSLALFLTTAAKSQPQVSATWNGTIITGPVLIYHDEILLRDGTDSIRDPNGPGALICRSETGRAVWRFPNSVQVQPTGRFDDGIGQTMTGTSVLPTLAQLFLRIEYTEQTRRTNRNGLWQCVLDNQGGTVDDFVPVGFYNRATGFGRITTCDVSLLSSSFLSDPQTFTLIGDTRGGPPTTYTWTRDGVEITNGGPFSISLAVNAVLSTDPTDEMVEAFEQTFYRSTLTVTGNLPGVYQYSVINRATPDLVTDSINMEDALAPIVTISSLSATSVAISWTQSELSPPVVEYTISLTRVTGSGQSVCSSLEDNRTAVTTNEQSMGFTRLEESSIYTVVVTAMFDAFGDRSTDMEFTTLSVAPTGTPRNVRIATLNTTRSITVSWDTIDCPDRNGVITGYAVEFWKQGGESISREVASQIFTADGITPGTRYTFRVAGVNAIGTGPFVEISNITDEETPGPLANLVAQPRFTSVVLTWTAPQEPNGELLTYEITYRVDGGNLVAANSTGLSAMFTIPSLTPQTRVSDISVSAYTGVGKGETAQNSDVLIPRDPRPPVVCNVQVEKLTSTAVRVSWDALHLPGITGYRIFYSKMLENRKTPSDQEVFAVNVSSSSENVVDVLGLANYVGYQFEVVATAELEGAEVLGNRSVTTMLILAPLSAPSETVATDEDEELFDLKTAISIVVTFILTLILYTTLLLLGCVLCCCQHSRERKERNASVEMRDEAYETIPYEAPSYLASSSQVEMESNLAYAPSSKSLVSSQENVIII